MIDPRQAAREWIAETISKHLHPDLGGADRIKHIAASIEMEAYEHDLPIELAVGMAVDWAHEQNEEAGLSHESR